MKIFLTLLLLMAMNLTLADEFSSINLYEPIPYKRETKFSQYIISKAEVWGGDVVGIKINNLIKKKVAPFSNDLVKYFPAPNELNNLIDNLASDINQTIVKGKLTDEKAIQMYSYIGKNLIGKIADKIMETEGVKDTSRRQLWVNKILNPFNDCMGRALNSQFDAGNCMDALTAGLVSNVGIGLVYELSRSNLSSSLPASEQVLFNQIQVSFYQSCMKNFLPNPTATNVNDCSLQAMRQGVESITKVKLSESIDSSVSSADVGRKIKADVWPTFDLCINKVGNTKSSIAIPKQFTSCIDNLVQRTGIQIVSDKVEHHPSLQSSFTAVELKKLGVEKSIQFKKCSQDLIAKDIRKNGMINTDICENAITNDLMYLAVLKKFNESAIEQAKGTDLDVKKLGTEGQKILDRCWKQNQNADIREICLRNSVIEFSKVIAEKRLVLAIPSDIANKDKIKADSLITFGKCLDAKLPRIISSEEHLSEKMEPCTTALLHSATESVVIESVEKGLEDNLKDQKDTSYAEERRALRTEILDRFHQCKKDNTGLNACTEQVKKDATYKIAIAAGRATRAHELPNAKTPTTEHLAVENELKRCTQSNLSNDALTKQLDDCKKAFVIEMGRVIGMEKFNSTLKDLLGEKKFEASKVHTGIVLKKFNTCLDNLYKDYKDIAVCTDKLAKDGELVFKENVNEWMSSSEKDAATIAIKAQFVDFLPCLSGLMPTGNSSPAGQVEKDAAPFMEILAKTIAQYIEYSPENAKQNLDELMKQFAKDVRESTDSMVARRNLIDLLYKNGAFDQFLKSYVRKLVTDSLAGTSDEELPKDLKNLLISKDNFDAIFSGPEGKRIKDAIHDELIVPIIVYGKSASGPEMKGTISAVTDQVTKLLVNSPNFGEKIIATQVQNSLDNMGRIKGWVVNLMYGSEARQWQKVRLTPEGQAAENYIKENIMTPKFKNITVSAIETKRINDEAEALVTEAVKKYKESKK